MKRRGFTLIELLVVLAIMALILGTVAAMWGLMFRSGGLRQGGLVVNSGVTSARMEASNTRTDHWVDLEKFAATGLGRIKIYRDSGAGNVGTLTPTGGSADLLIGKPLDLPQGCLFGKNDTDVEGAVGFPAWLRIASTGYVRYPTGYTSYQIFAFESNLSAGTPVGDLIMKVKGRSFKLYMDVNEVTGAIRKHAFYDN
jgi:prepilin-type N-terminal cleavage/methylation domain-containing protein